MGVNADVSRVGDTIVAGCPGLSSGTGTFCGGAMTVAGSGAITSVFSGTAAVTEVLAGGTASGVITGFISALDTASADDWITGGGGTITGTVNGTAGFCGSTAAAGTWTAGRERVGIATGGGQDEM